MIQSYLQKYKGRRKKINKLNRQELSALHYAVRYGHLNVINLLFQAKAGNAEVDLINVVLRVTGHSRSFMVRKVCLKKTRREAQNIY